jgi:hypothetical protein
MSFATVSVSALFVPVPTRLIFPLTFPPLPRRVACFLGLQVQPAPAAVSPGLATAGSHRPDFIQRNGSSKKRAPGIGFFGYGGISRNPSVR